MGRNQAVGYSSSVSHLVVVPVIDCQGITGLVFSDPCFTSLPLSARVAMLAIRICQEKPQSASLSKKGVYVCTGKNVVYIGFGTIHYSGIHWGLGKNSP